MLIVSRILVNIKNDGNSLKRRRKIVAQKVFNYGTNKTSPTKILGQITADEPQR